MDCVQPHRNQMAVFLFTIYAQQAVAVMQEFMTDASALSDYDSPRCAQLPRGLINSY
jgi:hypothetical protein